VIQAVDENDLWTSPEERRVEIRAVMLPYRC
jgi:hypothetical protein